MAMGSTLTITDPLTNATSGNLFTLFSSTWAALTSGSVMDIGPSGVTNDSTQTGALTGAVRIGTTFPNDQYSQAVLPTLASASYIGLGVRMSTASGGSGYLAQVVGTNQLVVSKLVNGTTTTLYNSGTSATFAAGDLLYLQIVGAFLRFYRNGVVYYQGADTAITSGAPGLSGGYGNQPSTVIKTWQGGNAVADPVLLPGFTAANGGAVNVTQGTWTANTWRTISLPVDATGGNGPPPNATGVMLGWVNQVATRIITRTTGSAFNTQPPTGTSTGTNQRGTVFSGMQPVGTPVTSFNVDMMIDNTGSQFYLGVFGYFGPETVWIEPPIVINPTGTMTPASPYSFTWASLTPAVPACAAVICNIWGVNAALHPSTVGSGEITKWLPASELAHSVICGYGSGTALFTADNSSVAPSIIVRGYMKSGITWENTAYDISPASTGFTYPQGSPAAQAANATGYLYRVHGTPAYIMQPVATGGSPAITYSAANGQVMEAWPQIRLNAASTPLTVGEQAYFNGVVPAAGPVTPTAIKAALAVRSTSQS